MKKFKGFYFSMKGLREKFLSFIIKTGANQADNLMIKTEQSISAEHPYAVYQSCTSGDWYTYIKDETKKEKRRKIHKKRKEDLIAYLNAYYAEQAKAQACVSKSKCIYEIFNLWLKWSVEYNALSMQTATRYTSAFKRYFPEKWQERDIALITEAELETFIRTSIVQKKMTAAAWSDLRILINGMWRYAHKNGFSELVVSSFMAELGLGKNIFSKPKTKNEVFTEEEISKLMVQIYQNPTQNNLCVALALKTGARAGEIAALNMSDINYQNQSIHINKREVRFKDPKTQKYIYKIQDGAKGEINSNGELKSREIYVTKETLDLIDRIHKLHPTSQYLYTKQNGERKKSHDLTIACYKLCDQVGIQRRSLHKCRKTYATQLYNAGTDELFIQSQLGHTDFKTTQSYYLRDNTDLKQKIEMLKRSGM